MPPPEDHERSDRWAEQRAIDRRAAAAEAERLAEQRGEEKARIENLLRNYALDIADLKASRMSFDERIDQIAAAVQRIERHQQQDQAVADALSKKVEQDSSKRSTSRTLQIAGIMAVLTLAGVLIALINAVESIPVVK